MVLQKGGKLLLKGKYLRTRRKTSPVKRKKSKKKDHGKKKTRLNPPGRKISRAERYGRDSTDRRSIYRIDHMKEI